MRILRWALVAALAGVLVSWASPAQADTDCADYSSQAAAQQRLRQDPSDPDGLDGNPGHNAEDNGVACETYNYPAGTPRDENSVYAQAATTTTAAPTVTTATTRPATTATTVARKMGNTGYFSARMFVIGMALLLFGWYLIFVVRRWEPIGFRLPWDDD